MRRLQTHVALVYCQGHVQNEAADEAVKAAAKGGPGDPSEDPTPIPYGVTATVLAQHFRRLQADEARHDDGHWAKICRDGPPKWKEHEAMTRAEQHILAQLRATKCSLLADYSAAGQSPSRAGAARRCRTWSTCCCSARSTWPRGTACSCPP